MSDRCLVNESAANQDAVNWGPLLGKGDLSFIRVLSENYFPGKTGECASQVLMKNLHNQHPELVDLSLDPAPAKSPKGHVQFSFPANALDPTYKSYDLNTWKFIVSSVVEKLSDRSFTAEQASEEVKTYLDPAKRGSFVEEFRKRMMDRNMPYIIDLGADHELVIKKIQTASDSR